PIRDRLQSPETRIKQREQQLSEANTLQNRLALVREYKQQERFAEAEAALEPALSGVFRDDPYVGYELAELYFLQKDYQGSIEQSEHILAQNAPFDLKPKLYLLLAESYSQSDPLKAEDYFEKAIPQSLSEEARVKYIAFLLSQGQRVRAEDLIKEVKRSYQQASSLYKREQKPWMGRLAELEKSLS
ncbi:MAG: hypothetical protein R2880_19205, partial [Deinococcales bacterium]